MRVSIVDMVDLSLSSSQPLSWVQNLGLHPVRARLVVSVVDVHCTVGICIGKNVS
jgi:hypothetical protein